MPRRGGAPEVNAGSMADIAFLLLIFFLVTSQMTEEAGMLTILPEKVNEDVEPPKPVNERNVIEVLVNDENKILFEGKKVKLNEISSLVKEMILNPSDDKGWPENKSVTKDDLVLRVNENKRALEDAPLNKQKSAKNKLKNSELRLKALDIFGDNFKKSLHVINMQATQGAEYDTYIILKDNLKQAYASLRNDLSKKVLGRGWDDLTDDEQKMLKMVYKENISEAPIVQN